MLFVFDYFCKIKDNIVNAPETIQNIFNRFKQSTINELWDSKKWDSGRWDGWGIILGFILPFFRDIWSRITSETLFLVVIFSILDLGRKKSMVSPSVRKINSGTISFETASKS